MSARSDSLLFCWAPMVMSRSAARSRLLRHAGRCLYPVNVRLGARSCSSSRRSSRYRWPRNCCRGFAGLGGAVARLSRAVRVSRRIDRACPPLGLLASWPRNCWSAAASWAAAWLRVSAARSRDIGGAILRRSARRIAQVGLGPALGEQHVARIRQGGAGIGQDQVRLLAELRLAVVAFTSFMNTPFQRSAERAGVRHMPLAVRRTASMRQRPSACPAPLGERVAAGVDTSLGEHLVTRMRWTLRARADADS